jgi:hypothetical protein
LNVFIRAHLCFVQIIPANSPECQDIFASAMAQPWNKQALGLDYANEEQQRQLPSPNGKSPSLFDRVRDSLTYRSSDDGIGSSSSTSSRNREEQVNGNGDSGSKNVGAETSEENNSRQSEEAKKIAAAEAAGAGLAGNAWSRVDYYSLLNLPHDLFSRSGSTSGVNHDDNHDNEEQEEQEEAMEASRKAYRAASRRYHPDKQVWIVTLPIIIVHTTSLSLIDI